MRQQRAFTLIELIITLAILAIVLAVAMPALSSWFARQRQAGASEAVLETLRFARKQAITRQSKIWLQSQSGDPWSLIVSSTPGEACEQALRCIRSQDFPGVTLNSSTLPARMAFSPLRGLPLDAVGQPLTAEVNIALAHPHCRAAAVQMLVTGFVNAQAGSCS